MVKPRVTVTQETATGRNTKFHDNVTGGNMTRSQFVKKIEQGDYPQYYVREINNLKTPVSKPDNKIQNNLD
jgi:hypothetical protein